MVENSSAGLVMLESAVLITVTREEYHQAVLSRYRVAPGTSRRVAVELGWCTIGAGKHRGERAIEVRLDGHRIGELTYLMSQRYGALVDGVIARGGRPGCAAVIQLGDRGLEVILRLPHHTGAAIPSRASFPAPFPALFPGSAAATLPAMSPVPPPVPVAARWRRPAWIGAAAVAGIVIVASIVGGQDGDPAPSSAADRSTTTVTTTSPLPTTTTTVTTTMPPPTTTTTTTVEPEPVVPEPEPEPEPPPEPEPQPACDPNYGGCVPVAPDVDCAGGSGNGPAYVAGPVTVVGEDVYDLDRDGDGTGCE